MTEHDLVSFLRENLKVCVSVSQKTEFGPDERISVEVDLYLGDTCISTAEDSASLPTPR